MFQMYQGYELASIKGVDNWQVQILSGGKLITTTMLFADEDSALAEAKRVVDGFGVSDNRPPCKRLLHQIRTIIATPSTGIAANAMLARSRTAYQRKRNYFFFFLL
jgi:hypothetical protein